MTSTVCTDNEMWPYDAKLARDEKLFQHTCRPVYLSLSQIQYLSESNLGLTYVINDINQFHDRRCPKNRVLWRKNKKKSMKMWQEFVTRGFQIAQLEERISLLINIFAFLKTWRARYLYYLARYVFGFLISLFSMQIRSSNWP